MNIEDLWMSLSEAQALQPLRAGGFAPLFYDLFLIIDPADNLYRFQVSGVRKASRKILKPEH